MVIHVLMAANTPFLHLFRLSPFLWPFNLCVPLARHIPAVCEAVSSTSSLLAFRFRQILAGPTGRRRTRWERAVRLFWDELLLPLSTATTADSSSGDRIDRHQEEEGSEYLQRRRHMLFSALDSSIIQGLLSLSI